MQRADDNINLHKRKNNELIEKIAKKDQEIMDLRLEMANSRVTVGVVPEETKYSRDLISSLHLTISEKDSALIRLQTELKNIEEYWRKKFNDLQDQNEQLTIYGKEYSKNVDR